MFVCSKLSMFAIHICSSCKFSHFNKTVYTLVVPDCIKNLFIIQEIERTCRLIIDRKFKVALQLLFIFACSLLTLCQRDVV